MFRYSEQELREFLLRHESLWEQELLDCDVEGDGFDYQYARGAMEAYQFVLRFMDEYKLEEVQ
jgi:hypothetical protein